MVFGTRSVARKNNDARVDVSAEPRAQDDGAVRGDPRASELAPSGADTRGLVRVVVHPAAPETGSVSLRLMTAADGAAYGKLLAGNPDSGKVRSSVHFEIDPYAAMAFVHPDSASVVAEAPGQDGLIGSASIRFDHRQWGGAVLPTAMFHSLSVRPDFRRRGVAARMVAWRDARVRERFGDECVAYSVIQKNNVGSERTIRTWSRQYLPDRIVTVPIPLRSSPPARVAGIDVRAAAPPELEEAADGQNRFYRSYALYPRETGPDIEAWCANTPFDAPYRHYVIAADPAGNVLAGLGVIEAYRLRRVVITQVPRLLALANKILHVVPADGVMRELRLNRIWFAPGQRRAARHLLETVRWRWRDRGTSIAFVADRGSPLLELCGLRRWSIRSIAGIALRSPTMLADDQLCYFT